MSYAITRLCRDCIDSACVSVCPVDCIVEHRPPAGAPTLPNQLFIQQETCIHCGLCEPECPWRAIYADDEIPEGFEDDLALNALSDERPDEFHVATTRLVRKPTPEEVEENEERWGLTSALEWSREAATGPR